MHEQPVHPPPSLTMVTDTRRGREFRLEIHLTRAGEPMRIAFLLDDGIGADDGVSPDGVDLAWIAGQVDASLEAFLRGKAQDGELGRFAELLRECLLAGGKRIRPVLDQAPFNPVAAASLRTIADAIVSRPA
jgi:hypothetical protein